MYVVRLSLFGWFFGYPIVISFIYLFDYLGYSVNASCIRYSLWFDMIYNCACLHYIYASKGNSFSLIKLKIKSKQDQCTLLHRILSVINNTYPFQSWGSKCDRETDLRTRHVISI